MASTDANFPVRARSKEEEPQACTFMIPAHLIAEAMTSLHGNLDLRWSGPITPSEMRFVEQYVQARYPEYYAGLGGAIGKKNLPREYVVCNEDGEISEDGSGSGSQERRSPGLPANREFSASFGNVPSGIQKTQLEENSYLQEILIKRACMSDTSISVPEMHARNRVFKHCGVTDDDYIAVFMTGVKEAMLLVGESYPFQKYTYYMSAFEEEMDAIKQFAASKEARFIQAPASWLDLRIAGSHLSQNFRRKCKHSPKGLFAYPADLRGTRNSLHWVSEAQRNHWHVLLDCTELMVGEDNRNLTMHKPDFVLCTLFKVPGQSTTKATCLLVRRNSFIIQTNK